MLRCDVVVLSPFSNEWTHYFYGIPVRSLRGSFSVIFHIGGSCCRLNSLNLTFFSINFPSCFPFVFAISEIAWNYYFLELLMFVLWKFACHSTCLYIVFHIIYLHTYLVVSFFFYRSIFSSVESNVVPLAEISLALNWQFVCWKSLHFIQKLMWEVYRWKGTSVVIHKILCTSNHVAYWYYRLYRINFRWLNCAFFWGRIMNQSVHVVNLVSSMITLVFFFGDSKELGRLRSGFLHWCIKWFSFLVYAILRSPAFYLRWFCEIRGWLW